MNFELLTYLHYQNILQMLDLEDLESNHNFYSLKIETDNFVQYYYIRNICIPHRFDMQADKPQHLEYLQYFLEGVHHIYNNPQ